MSRMNNEHLFISDLRKHPRAEVCLLIDGRLVSGTYPGQVTRSIDDMLREAWEQGKDAGLNGGWDNPHEVKS